MGRVEPFLFVVIRTNSAASGFDVVPAASDEAERGLVVFGPASEPACWHHIVLLRKQTRDTHAV
jgi:hypothetical protein